MLRRGLLAVVALLASAAPAAAQAPIPEGPQAGSLKPFIGAPAAQRPVEAADPPRHPFMAPNSRSNLHVDAYQTDVHQGPGPLGNGHVARVETFLSARLRVGDVRLARADRDRLRRRRRAAAVHDGRRGRWRRWPRSRCRRAMPGRRQHLQRLRRRRLLLPRRARPGGDPDDHAPPARRAPDRRRPGFELERDYDLTGAVALRRQDHLRAARLVRALWFVSQAGRGRDRRPRERRGDARCRCARRSRTRSRSTRPAASTSSPTRAALPVRRGLERLARRHLARGLRELRDLQAGPGRRRARARRRRCSAATASRSPTTPTR